ncbi:MULTISPECIES: hypothetical protein [unclassified Nonomuraea]|uniref:hypothetical protein n=1 Tax=unclassified Nonomuraea TaxID=2593643 RepID=UPI0033F262A0
MAGHRRPRPPPELETVYWDAGTARLLPRLLKGRTRGPVFLTHRRPGPGPGKVVSPRDLCPDTGLARLSYGQARALLDQHTALNGPGTGWDLHEFRHSALTHLGEAGASLLMLMARSRHKKPENLRRYFQPLTAGHRRDHQPARPQDQRLTCPGSLNQDRDCVFGAYPGRTRWPPRGTSK